jgi:hypothetical protein
MYEEIAMANRNGQQGLWPANADYAAMISSEQQINQRGHAVEDRRARVAVGLISKRAGLRQNGPTQRLDTIQ